MKSVEVSVRRAHDDGPAALFFNWITYVGDDGHLLGSSPLNTLRYFPSLGAIIISEKTAALIKGRRAD